MLRPSPLSFQAGDIIVRAGAFTVDPRESSSKIFTEATNNLPGTRTTSDSDTQLDLNFAYMITDKVGIELLAATPFSHSVGIKDMFLNLDGKLSDIKHLPPTVSAVVYLLDSKSVFHPYVGLGINYTTFLNESLTSCRKAEGFAT